MDGRRILKSKAYLYITEFFAGMSVMAVELGASRLLAPYFSSSQIVWTIIIGTIMIAMALGNIYGGRTADKNPDPDRLYGRIVVAAVWIALIPVVGKYIILGISGLLVFTISTNYLIIAAFAACMVVFVFPLFLLGTVTPSLVKYTVDSLDDSGKVVGMLNASNTVGSIIGTFVPTFVSIPAVGTSITFLIFAGVLLLLAVVYFVSGKSKKGITKVTVAGVIFVLCCIFGHGNNFAFWTDDLVVEDESIYNYLQVSEDSSSVILSTNTLFGVQSVYRKEKGLTGMYYDYAMAAPYMAGLYEKEEPLRVLILGMGTGTYATQCRRYFGDMYIEGVEIDEKITALAHKYFELPDDIKVVTYDGRAYLSALAKMKEARKAEAFDVIMVDAYQDITIPFQMSSAEFFSLVKEMLADDGVMVVNMNMQDNSGQGINDYLSDTIASVFGEVYTVNVSAGTNRELFAGNISDLPGRMAANLEKEENEELVRLMTRVSSGLSRYENKDLVMTDDKAPVELLGMKAIDGIIADEVGYYKKIYETEGIKGVIDMLFE
ncbi:MAG: fused MFS/spermidine synthase [Lachnospiraceae bacterium]|nr:fused MFS/spermidine synthase [Lachnospiraceae bacterium]